MIDDPRDEHGFYWYKMCVERASAHPVRSVEHTFWWSLRFLFDWLESEGGQAAFDDWIEYLAWKLGVGDG